MREREKALMDEDQFWQIIESSREDARKVPREPIQDFLDVHEQTLAAALRTLSPEKIIGFNNRFWNAHHRAYRWNLWAAAYWTCGGCGGDGFIDFRACLISLGRKAYEQVLRDPDSLAEIVDQPDLPCLQCEGFQYVASKVYREKTGDKIPLGTEESPLGTEESPLLPRGSPPGPTGERIDEEDVEVMRRHFPRLVAKFPKGGDF